MSSAPRYNPHYTVADYQQWQGDWELWNGVAIAMSPSPTRRHQRTLFSLAMQAQQGLAKNDACRCQLVVDVDWRVSDDTVVRPDLSILCTPSEGDYIQETPTLIAEVLSPSTAHKDRNEKRSLYENRGVAWYLMLDPETKQLTVLRQTEGRYTPVDFGSAPETRIDLHEGCEFTLEPGKLFD